MREILGTSLLATFLLVAPSLFLASCRSDKPPQLSIVCTLDGLGGGDCADPQGKYIYKSPSEMKDFWATTQTDEANFASWCYGTPPTNGVANNHLEGIKARIQAAKARYLAEKEASS